MKTNQDLEFITEFKRIKQQFNKSSIIPIALIILWLFGVFVAFGGLKKYGF